MFSRTIKGLVLSSFVYGNLAQAFPASSHLGEPSVVIDRLNSTSVLDFSEAISKSVSENQALKKLAPLSLIISEPLVRSLWLSQLFTETDWIAMQGLASIHNKMDPGGSEGDGSNVFMYGCKAGWIDMGHLVLTALAHKVMLQGLTKVTLVKSLIPGFLEKSDGDRFMKVAKQLTDAHLAKDDDRKVTVDGITGDRWFWARYFAMKAGYKIEDTQTKTKQSQKQGKYDANATSAYTLEDLPSDYFGTQIAEKMERKHTVRGVVNVFKREMIQMMKDYKVVDLENEVNDNGRFTSAREIMSKDADYYKKQVENSQVNVKDKEASRNSLSVYNYTKVWKKTKSHNILCDENGNPRGTENNKTAGQENPSSPKPKRKFGHPGHI